ELRALVALRRSGLNVTVVGGKTRNTENTGLFVEQFVHFVGRFVFFLHNIEHRRRVNGAGTCAHDLAVQRGRPMEVSKTLPFFTAVIEEPLPKWQVTSFSSSSGRPITSAQRLLT